MSQPTEQDIFLKSIKRWEQLIHNDMGRMRVSNIKREMKQTIEQLERKEE